LQILRAFTNNTKNLLSEIVDVRKENLDDYAITVHGIKGASRGICADLVGDIAEELEIAAKEGDFEYVSQHTPNLVKAVEKLVTSLNEMITKISAGIQKPQKAAPDKDILSKIVEACKTYDMQTVEACIKELESYEYETGGEIVQWLWENVQQFNIDEIIARVETV
jgi:HPt (histidine-containing phosphotransfer) domain-containing protein